MEKTETHLTEPHDARMARLMRQSKPGQAHWAGTGPEGKRCHHCIHWKPEGSTGYTAKGDLKPGRCGQYRKMMGKSGPAFSHTQLACRFFEQAPGIYLERASSDGINVVAV